MVCCYAWIIQHISICLWNKPLSTITFLPSQPIKHLHKHYVYSVPTHAAQYALPSWEEVKNIHCASAILELPFMMLWQAVNLLYMFSIRYVNKDDGLEVGSQSRHSDFTPVTYTGKTPRSSSEEALQRDSLYSSPSRLRSTRGTFISPTVWFLIGVTPRNPTSGYS